MPPEGPEGELRAAVVQDAGTGRVLMLAWMDDEALRRRIAERARDRPEGSYVAALLERGTRACAQKVGEEAVEAALAAVAEDDERLVAELADLWFHSYVLLAARGLDPAQVEDELARRARSYPAV